MASKKVSISVDGDSTSTGKEAETITVLSPQETTVRLLSVEDDVREIRKILEMMCLKMGCKTGQQPSEIQETVNLGKKPQEFFREGGRTSNWQEGQNLEGKPFQEVITATRILQEQHIGFQELNHNPLFRRQTEWGGDISSEEEYE
ncbi:hypothetical protein NP118_23730, partial [Salmonella enterica]|nr:hypothetical protein [Salmonella enterica]